MTKIQQKPIIHGRDHMPGGADPIPGTAATAVGNYQEQVLAEPSLVGYWPLDDASEPALDHSGHGHHLTETGGLSPTYQQGGPFAGYAVAFTTSSAVAGNTQELGVADDSFDFDGVAPYTLEIMCYPTSVEALYESGIMGLYHYPSGNIGGIYMVLQPTGANARKVSVRRAGESHLSPVPITLDEWVHLATTYDGATLCLYFDGELQVSVATTSIHSGTGDLTLGTYRSAGSGGLERDNLHGRLAHAAIYNTALSASTIASHANAGATGAAGTTPPGSGWQFPPPGGSGSVGVGSPPSGWTGATDPGGYYYQAHVETVVLTDSSPGRFDVPPRTWTRIPFNHITIQRQYQPSAASGAAVNVLLPDDRGLTAAAQNGVLQLPDAAYDPGDPTPDQQVYAWCNPEYPPLDGDRLPNYTTPPWSSAPDRYCRALRIRNVTTGSILRAYDFEDGMWRVFFEWPFAEAGAPEGLSMARNDNPFPKYPPWPARPMHKNLPYPEIPGGISAWLNYYEDEVGYSSWKPIGASHYWDPGTQFVAEVWQDTPYLLRFTTAVYPHHEGFAVPPGWLGLEDEILVYNLHQQPYLTVSYPFDPATIDHTTGVLL